MRGSLPAAARKRISTASLPLIRLWSEKIVHVWRQKHPDGRKADCHRDTGLDPKTIRKWWDSEPSAVWQEDGHMVARVRPSQALSDLLVEALGQGKD